MYWSHEESVLDSTPSTECVHLKNIEYLYFFLNVELFREHSTFELVP